MPQGKFLDLIGHRFGKLLVIGKIPGTHTLPLKWECRCDCGNVINIDSYTLKKQNSCRCVHIEGKWRLRHGHNTNRKISPESRAWIGMKQRCYNEKNKEYHCYGKLGINVCQRWMDSFENFLQDMGMRPSKKHSIERLNVYGNYEPSNCVWATSKEQSRNKRDTAWVVYKGDKISLLDICEQKGFNISLIRSRKNQRKISYQDAFESVVNPFKFINHSFGHIT